ncbi:MAG: nuclease-related domain-containing protein [Phycisphaerales bacterium]
MGVLACTVGFASSRLLNGGQHFWLTAGISLVAAVGLGVVSLRRFTQTIEPLQTGLHGERAVSLVLRDLERQGYSVFHDVPSLRRPNEANLDHVVIGPTGVFAIETKTIRKRGRQYTLEFCNDQISINDHPLCSDPIGQARAVADDLAYILDRFAGRKCAVQPVVAIPGWFVRADKTPWQQPVWVVNHNALVTLITSPHRPRLPNGLDRQLAGALQTHIRAAAAAEQ